MTNDSEKASQNDTYYLSVRKHKTGAPDQSAVERDYVFKTLRGPQVAAALSRALTAVFNKKYRASGLTYFFEFNSESSIELAELMQAEDELAGHAYTLALNEADDIDCFGIFEPAPAYEPNDPNDLFQFYCKAGDLERQVPDRGVPAETSESQVSPSTHTPLAGSDSDLSDLTENDSWPPSDHVAVFTIGHSAEYEKNGKNPPRTTIQQWEKKESVIKQYHPQSNEVAYPQEWVSRHWDAWFPRPPKRNTPT